MVFPVYGVADIVVFVLYSPVAADVPAHVGCRHFSGLPAGEDESVFLADPVSGDFEDVAADAGGLAGMREIDALCADDPAGPSFYPAAAVFLRYMRRGSAEQWADFLRYFPLQCGLVSLDQEGDRLRRFRALLPCEVVVTALAHPLCGCRVRAYAFRHVDGVPHLKVELPDGMPGLVAADATDVFGAGPAAAGAGLVLDGAGLRHLRAVVTRLRDGDPAGEQR